MDYVGIVLFFILGAFTGTLDNLVAYRYAKGNTLFFPKKSRCEVCKHDLTLPETLPVIGFLLHGGKCAYCDERISLKHPVLEIITGILFALLFVQYGWSITTVAGCIMMAALLMNCISDLVYGRVLNYVTYGAIVIGVLFSSFFGLGFVSALAGLSVFVVLNAFVFFFSKGSMAGGDVKVAAIIGAFAGLPGVLLTFVLSSLMGAVVGLFSLVFQRAKTKTRQFFHFSVYWVISGFIAYTYMAELINLYMSFFPNV